MDDDVPVIPAAGYKSHRRSLCVSAIVAVASTPPERREVRVVQKDDIGCLIQIDTDHVLGTRINFIMQEIHRKSLSKRNWAICSLVLVTLLATTGHSRSS